MGAAQGLAAIAQGFGDMDARDAFLAVEIGEGPGDTQRAVIASGTQAQRVGRLAQ